jgi:hypothetical protein
MHIREARGGRQDDLRKHALTEFKRFSTALGAGTETPAIDEPDDPAGEWWIDVQIAGFEVTLAWRHDQGFGIFSGDDVGYGDKPNEIYRQPDFAAKRVLQMAELRSQGLVPGPLSLGDVRRLLDQSQTAVADALGIGQAVISRLENRHDARLGTIIDYVKALGGEAQLVVRFDAFEAPIELSASSRKPTASDASAGAPKTAADAVLDLLQGLGRDSARVAGQWVGSLSDWIPRLPARQPALASDTAETISYVGVERPLAQLLPDSALEKIPWASGSLRLMGAQESNGRLRSIRVALSSTSEPESSGSAIAVVFSDTQGVSAGVLLTPDKPYTTQATEGLSNWANLTVTVAVLESDDD